MRGTIAWFAKNPVAANLLMALVVVSGILSMLRVRQEIIPEVDVESVSISVVYPGAAPEEVEEGICLRVEEAIQGLEGVDRVRSAASEGVGVVTLEAVSGTDMRRLLDDVQSEIDRIDSFPDEAEEPIVAEVELALPVLDVAVWGPTDGGGLRRIAEEVRDGLTALPEISLVELSNARPYEISIEVSEAKLRQYGMTFDEVANAVRSSSLDLPGGAIKTTSGEILLRSKGQAYVGGDFETLPLRTTPDGRRLLLGDVAQVVDGFEDTDQESRFNGEAAVLLSVFRVGDQSALEIARAAKEYLVVKESEIPEGLHLTVANDDTKILKDRLSLMIRNGRAGLVLVLLTLAIFLRLRLALWVTIGIPVSFLGALWLMPGLGASINLISLFAFIVVLGIVVDDAIVVAENIYAHRQRGKPGMQAAIEGAQEIGIPVVFAVLTTIAAFAPMLVMPGTMGQFSRVVPLIVIATLIFSLVESLWVLPCHLTHLPVNGEEEKGRIKKAGWWLRFQLVVQRLLQGFIEKVYVPSLDFALRWRYLTLAGAVTTLLLTLGLLFGGHLKFYFFPPIEADNVVAELEMPLGTPAEQTSRILRRLEDAAKELQAELTSEEGLPLIRNIITSVGGQPFKDKQDTYSALTGTGRSGGHLGEINLELLSAETRRMSSTEIGNRWRERAGRIAGVSELSFNTSITSTGDDIDIRLSGPDVGQLTEAAQELRRKLASYEGVYEVSDSFREGKRELKLRSTPAAESLGLSLGEMARQVRQAYYGEEAQRVQRGRDEVKVMVRYPEAERRSLADLAQMRVRTPAGSEIPFPTVAEVEEGRGYSSIDRVDRQRSVNVTAAVDETRANANEILAELESGYLPELVSRYRGVQFGYEGQQREQAEFLEALVQAFAVALVVIFALLAIPLRSYVQPIIIMTAIPFGLVGAVWGHLIVGMDLVIFSVIGVVALSGVVVNDSLVMVDFVNRARRAGESVDEAVRSAGVKRFRAILLTSLTTFAGLTPLLLEKSLQAQFIIPMAVSLAFGVIFATFITLVLVPSSYLILEDIRALFRFGRKPREEPARPAAAESPADAARTSAESPA